MALSLNVALSLLLSIHLVKGPTKFSGLAFCEKRFDWESSPKLQRVGSSVSCTPNSNILRGKSYANDLIFVFFLTIATKYVKISMIKKMSDCGTSEVWNGKRFLLHVLNFVKFLS